MKTLQFDDQTGITLMSDDEWDDDADFLGTFSGESYDYISTFFSESFEGSRAVQISDDLYDELKKNYTVKE